MRLLFDRGTILLDELPADFGGGQLPGVLWDPRVRAFRAPARLAYPLATQLARSRVPVSDKPRPGLPPPSAFRPIELRPYQDAALGAWRLGGRRGIIVLPTGAGKTRVALAAIAQIRAPALCLVPTRALLAQWQRALSLVHDGPIGVLGDGERRLAPVTIATFASARHHMPVIGDRFGLLVVDEAHHFGSGRWDEALEMAIAPLRLGLTATPLAPGAARDRLAQLLGPTLYELSLGELAGTFLAPFDRLTLWLRLDPDERRTYDELVGVYRRAFDAIRAARPALSWDELCRLAAGTDEGRRGLAAWRKARRLLSFPAAKRAALASLLARHRDRRTLVFVADNDAAYRIAREHLVMPITCDVSRGERQAAIDAFAEGRLRALVSSQVLNEGLDVPGADVGVIVGGRLGGREHVQRIGRVLRPAEGKRAIVYELVVQGTAEVRQAERRSAPLAPRERSAVAGA